MKEKPKTENHSINNTYEIKMKLTYDTCEEHHTGNPFLLHYQSATQPAK